MEVRSSTWPNLTSKNFGTCDVVCYNEFRKIENCEILSKKDVYEQTFILQSHFYIALLYSMNFQEFLKMYLESFARFR